MKITMRLTGFVVLILFVSGCLPKQAVPKTDAFLDSLSHHTFNFFWEQAEPSNGNQPDRWPSQSFSSIAANSCDCNFG